MTEREKQILEWIRKNPLISQQELADKAGITRSSVGVHISNLMKKGLIAGRGYVVPEIGYAAVVGGVNVDIGGASLGKLIMKDSNPGAVHTSLGGVGRNIAHNMSLLGVPTRMLTVFGEDANADRIVGSCSELGIDVSDCMRIQGGRTSTYLFINDESGDMQLAINDMEIYQHLTPELIESKAALLRGAEAIVIDTNIPQESIEYIANNFTVPIFADPVSTIKAAKLKNVIGKIHTLKPNKIEAELLSGVSITDEKSLYRAIETLLDMGLKRIFLTMGSNGALIAEKGKIVRLPAVAAECINATGCGDAFTAALVWSYLQDMDLVNSGKAGIAAATIAMASEETINRDMSEDKLLEIMNIEA